MADCAETSANRRGVDWQRVPNLAVRLRPSRFRNCRTRTVSFRRA